MNDDYFYFAKEHTMTPRLVLTGQKSFEEITKFFKEAGPDARIRAKKHGDVVELYVRDLSIKG